MSETERNVLGGHYELLKTLGSGSYGKVKLARDRRTNEFVAVKAMLKVDEKTGEDHLPAITNEIHALRRLGSHPLVTSAHEVLITRRRIFLVMRLAAGEVLGRLGGANGYLHERRARYIFQQLIETVIYGHSRGVAHRDIKPSNLLVSERGDLLLSDFGLATLAESDYEVPHPALIAKTACGSPHYVAPEIVNVSLGAGAYNPFRADLWSCGVTLYVLLTGRMPFHGATYKELYAAVRSGEIRWPDNISISAEAREVVHGLCTPDPKARWSVTQLRTNAWYRGGWEDAMAGVDHEFIVTSEGCPPLPPPPTPTPAPETLSSSSPMPSEGTAPLSTAEERALAALEGLMRPQTCCGGACDSGGTCSRSDTMLPPDSAVGKGFYSVLEFICNTANLGHSALATPDPGVVRSYVHAVGGRSRRVQACRSHRSRSSDPLDAIHPRLPPPAPPRMFPMRNASGQRITADAAPHLADLEDLGVGLDTGSPCGLECTDCTEDLTCPSSSMRSAHDAYSEFWLHTALPAAVERLRGALGVSVRVAPGLSAGLVALRTKTAPETEVVTATLGVGPSVRDITRRQEMVAQGASVESVFPTDLMNTDRGICERVDLRVTIRSAGAQVTFVEMRRVHGSSEIARKLLMILKNTVTNN